MQTVCKKVVTSSSVASPKYFCEGQIAYYNEQRYFIRTLPVKAQNDKVYARNLGGMVSLPPWLRLWLQEKNEKERTVLT